VHKVKSSKKTVGKTRMTLDGTWVFIFFNYLILVHKNTDNSQVYQGCKLSQKLK